jgi:hypothetical protein
MLLDFHRLWLTLLDFQRRCSALLDMGMSENDGEVRDVRDIGNTRDVGDAGNTGDAGNAGDTRDVARCLLLAARCLIFIHGARHSTCIDAGGTGNAGNAGNAARHSTFIDATRCPTLSTVGALEMLEMRLVTRHSSMPLATRHHRRWGHWKFWKCCSSLDIHQ